MKSSGTSEWFKVQTRTLVKMVISFTLPFKALMKHENICINWP